MAITNGSFEEGAAGAATGWTRNTANSRMGVAPFTGDDRPVERFTPSGFLSEHNDLIDASCNPESFENSAFIRQLANVVAAAFDTTLPAEDFEGLWTGTWNLFSPAFINRLLIPFDVDVRFQAADNCVLRVGQIPTPAAARSTVYSHHLATEAVSNVSLVSADRAVTAAEFVTWFMGTFGRDEAHSPFTASVITRSETIDGVTTTRKYVQITADRSGGQDHIYLPTADAPTDTGWERLGISTSACWFRSYAMDYDLTAAVFSDSGSPEFENFEAEQAVTAPDMINASFIGMTLIESFEGDWDSW